MKKVIAAKLALWDASTDAEELLGRDVDTQSCLVDDLCVTLGGAEDIGRVTDDELVAVFGKPVDYLAP